jgi:hypothetical protein
LGDNGVHVFLIQIALNFIDNVAIDENELSSMSYGQSTASAVLAYKRKRSIINRSYQQTPDNIVGKMTIDSLDKDMALKESSLISLAGFAAPFLRGLFLAPSLKMQPASFVVVTEKNAPFLNWARSFAKGPQPFNRGIVEIANGTGIDQVAAQLKRAATTAGRGGVVILSVGHGSLASATGSNDEGAFELGPAGSFIVAGRNATIKPTKAAIAGKFPKPSHVSVFYDFRVPDSTQKSGFRQSDKERDEAQSGNPNARTRLDNFRRFEDVARTFKGIGLSAVILLTCKVGGASGFMKRFRQHIGVPLIAYTRRVAGQELSPTRSRLFLEGDSPGSGTNIPFNERMIPLSKDMVVF